MGLDQITPDCKYYTLTTTKYTSLPTGGYKEEWAIVRLDTFVESTRKGSLEEYAGEFNLFSLAEEDKFQDHITPYLTGEQVKRAVSWLNRIAFDMGRIPAEYVVTTRPEVKDFLVTYEYTVVTGEAIRTLRTGSARHMVLGSMNRLVEHEARGSGYKVTMVNEKLR